MMAVELKTYLPCRDGELIMSRYLELEELPRIGTQLSVDGATWRVIEVYLEDHDDGRHWRVEADPPEDLACGSDMDPCAAAWAQEGWTIDNQLEPSETAYDAWNRLVKVTRPGPTGSNLQVDRRELATILAALRFHQDENLQGSDVIPARLIRRIASDHDAFTPLNFQEVSALCKRLKHRKSVPPALRGSMQAGSICSRSWTCPRCDRRATCSYEDLAQAGTPLCTDCDIEMELQ